MYEVKALTSFDHHGARREGDSFTVGSKRQAGELEAKGLVEIVGEAPEPEATKEEPKQSGKSKSGKAKSDGGEDS